MQNNPKNTSLSTMWFQNKGLSLVQWWEHVEVLGFQQIELSHIVTPQLLQGVDTRAIPISSIHFPAPTIPHPQHAGPADVLISSRDNSLRQWAVMQGKRSIELAAESGAGLVCIHAGTVDLPANLEWVLYQRYSGSYFGTPPYHEALETLLQVRAAYAVPHISAVRRSLDALARHAQMHNVRLGIETRLHAYEIPSFSEAGTILDEHDPDILGLWFDSGHVAVQENLGMETQTSWLEAYGPRIAGAHLHDTIGLRDHLIPGTGAIDFAEVSTHLPQTCVRVCEFDWYFDAVEIQEGAALLAQAGCCPPLSSLEM